MDTNIAKDFAILRNLGAGASAYTQCPSMPQSKVIFGRFRQLLAINAHKMAPRTGKRLQERTWDTLTKGLLWIIGMPSCKHMPSPRPFRDSPGQVIPRGDVYHSAGNGARPSPEIGGGTCQFADFWRVSWGKNPINNLSMVPRSVPGRLSTGNISDQWRGVGR